MERRAVSRRKSLLPDPAEARSGKVVALDAELELLREHLSRTPPELPCKFLYDDQGSALFEKITQLSEYFPTRTERALLAAHSAEIAADGIGDLVELGSGAAAKTIAILEAALARGQHPRYVAVDISAHALHRTRQLLAGLPVRVEAVKADYTRPFQLPRKKKGVPRLVLFLGGTIGNEEDAGAIELLSRVREQMEPGDRLLLGANLVTEPAAIHAAYNDSQGVTAEFNKNVLRAVNAQFGAQFEPADFDHHAPYVVERRRVEMWLVARKTMAVDLGRIGGTLKLTRGAGIRTEISRRFTRDEVLRLIDAAGWTPQRFFESKDGRFGLALGSARAALRGI